MYPVSKAISIGVLFLCTSLGFSQDIQFMRSYYADDFRDWIFFDSEDHEIGSMRARFQLKEDYSQWDFRVGELSGFILQRWNGKANEWEIRSGNTFITVTATWPGQFDSWRISTKDKVYYLIRDRPVLLLRVPSSTRDIPPCHFFPTERALQPEEPYQNLTC